MSKMRKWYQFQKATKFKKLSKSGNSSNFAIKNAIPSFLISSAIETLNHLLIAFI